MAQEKKVESGAFADLNGGQEGPRVAPDAYGGIGATGRVVLLLAKASTGYCPLAAARLQDLPEELRRQLGGFDGRAGYGGHAAVALAPLSGEGPAGGYLLVHAGHHVVVPENLLRPLAGEVLPPIHRNTGHVAVANKGSGAPDDIRDCSHLRVLKFVDNNERVVYWLDASPIPQVPENIVFPAWVEVSGVLYLDAAAFAREHGTPFSRETQLGRNGAAGLGLGALDPSGVVFVRDDADSLVEKLLGNNRNNKHGAPYSNGGRHSPYAVQVLVDPAVGAKAGDPIPLGPGAKVARADAGYQDGRHGGGNNLSAVVGILAASSAVTAVGTGDVNPTVAFGSFLVLLGGVVAAMAGVRDP